MFLILYYIILMYSKPLMVQIQNKTAGISGLCCSGTIKQQALVVYVVVAQ